MTTDPRDMASPPYGDLLNGSTERGGMEVVRDLDAYHRRVNPARWLPETFHDVDATVTLRLGGRGASREPRGARVRLALPALCVLLVSSGIVLAASNILNLGKPTNTLSTNSYRPLGGFHRVRPGLMPPGKPEVLFVNFSTPDLGPYAIEGWPLVKALEQFGRLSGLKALPLRCFSPPPPPGQPAGPPRCSIPGFDFHHAHFHSRYVSLVYRDLSGEKDCPVRALTAAEWTLYVQYAQPFPTNRNALCRRYKSHPIETDIGILPFLLAGNYVQAGTNLIGTDDFYLFVPSQDPRATPGTDYPQTLTFEQVQSALVSGHDPKNSTLVEDVNAETNIITALICHADGGRPKSTCTRPVIRQMLKHVR